MCYGSRSMKSRRPMTSKNHWIFPTLVGANITWPFLRCYLPVKNCIPSSPPVRESIIFDWLFTDECIQTFRHRLFYKDNLSACDRSSQESKQLGEAQALIKNDSSDLFNEIRMTLLISLPELINHGWLSLYFILYQYHSLTLMCTQIYIKCISHRTGNMADNESMF